MNTPISEADTVERLSSSFTDEENQYLSGESENGYVQNSKKVWKNLQEDSY